MDKSCVFILICSLICYCPPQIDARQSVLTDSTCRGRFTFKNITLTAYYPNYDEYNSVENLDIRGQALGTLQDYLDGNVDYVTVSMDKNLKISYAMRICIPELNEHYGRHINFEVRDTASNVNGKGLHRVDICVRSEPDSYDHAVNLKQATVVI